MSSIRTAALVLLPASLSLALACGSSPGSEGFPDPDGTGASSGASGGSSSFGGASGGASGASGTGDPSCAATVAQTTKAKVDIIFVIDNSGSMNDEMNQIKANVNTFAQKIGGVGLDYTVTFIVRKATSAGQTGNVICVPVPLGGPNCADNAPTFHHVDQSVGSTDSFKLILSTYETSWKSYLRADATKVFVEVTDDRSAMAYADFDAQLLAKAPAGMFGSAANRKYVWHSIISKPFNDAVPSTKICSGAAGSSVDYQELSKLTGGLIDEVCKVDYSGVLDNIAKGIVDKLGCELGYPSAAEADPTKLVVTFTPKGQAAQNLTQVTDASKCGTIPNAWYYDDAAKPTKIILCPTTCSTANASTDGKLEALVGCKAAPPS